MHIAHHPIFIALSSLTAWLGAWTALDVFRRVRAHVGGWRLAWLTATAVAMGLSIWSMHFIAMMGFNPGVEVRYDVGRTVLSLLLAIATTAFAFFFARGGGARREIMGGVVMGAGICTMHYVGMSAVITGVTLVNEPVYVVLAFVVAVSASTSALFVARSDTTSPQRVLAAAVLAFAIVGMHYTAMFGVRVLPGPVSNVGSGGVDSLALAIAVATGTLFILLLALIAAISDRRFEIAAVREASRSEQQLRAILDHLPIGVFVAVAPSGEVRFANREAVRVLGSSLEGEALWAREGAAWFRRSRWAALAARRPCSLQGDARAAACRPRAAELSTRGRKHGAGRGDCGADTGLVGGGASRGDCVSGCHRKVARGGASAATRGRGTGGEIRGRSCTDARAAPGRAGPADRRRRTRFQQPAHRGDRRAGRHSPPSGERVRAVSVSAKQR